MSRLNQLNRVLSVKALVVGIVAIVLTALFTFGYAESIHFPDHLPVPAPVEE